MYACSGPVNCKVEWNAATIRKKLHIAHKKLRQELNHKYLISMSWGNSKPVCVHRFKYLKIALNLEKLDVITILTSNQQLSDVTN